MARVTVQDCVGDDKTNNRFELVKLAAKRTEDIQSGSPITVSADNDKITVIALREIASGTVKISDLRERYINSLHPQSAIGTLDEELDDVDKDIVEEVFSNSESEMGLTEDQMTIDSDDMQGFEDIDLSEEEKF